MRLGEAQAKLWDIDQEKVAIIVPAAELDSEVQYGNGYVTPGPGDIGAIHYIRESLLTLVGSDNLGVYYDEIGLDDALIDHHLIVVGGPYKNSLANIYLRAFRDSGTLDVDILLDDPKEEYHLSTPGGESHRATFSDKGRLISTDFGIIVKKRNPFNERRWVFVLAGLHNTGTTGSGAILRCEPVIRKIAKYSGDGEFQIAHKTKLLDRNPFNSEIKFIYPDYLKKEVIVQPFLNCGKPEDIAKELFDLEDESLSKYSRDELQWAFQYGLRKLLSERTDGFDDLIQNMNTECWIESILGYHSVGNAEADRRHRLNYEIVATIVEQGYNLEEFPSYVGELSKSLNKSTDEIQRGIEELESIGGIGDAIDFIYKKGDISQKLNVYSLIDDKPL